MSSECAAILETLHEVAAERTQWRIIQSPRTPWRGVKFALLFEAGTALVVWMAVNAWRLAW